MRIQGQLSGFDAWQGYRESEGDTRNGLRMLRMFKYDSDVNRKAWTQAAQNVLEDFAVWYDTGHYREEGASHAHQGHED